MNHQAQIYYDKKFFGHLLPRYQQLCIEAVLKQKNFTPASKGKPQPAIGSKKG